jgi:hypothetical protein
MRGIVWGSLFATAASQLEKIEADYNFIGVQTTIKRQHPNKLEIEFSNGDYWCAVCASDSARGRKCNVSYIDRNISEETVKCLILPCTHALPFTAHRYY